jgi:hypothetical protein
MPVRAPRSPLPRRLAPLAPLLALLPALAAPSPAAAQAAPAAAPAAPAPQTEADAYTRYELLAPGSAKFRILYEVTATTPGATAYFNPIRPGSVASDERVTDLATGRPLRFDLVSGAVARAGGVRGADSLGQYIRVTLARPVPPHEGEARILIDKTYEDAKSYHADGPEIVFERSFGIKRNAVVLPPGYELVSCNFPSQLLQEADGRLMVSFWNATPAPAPLVLRARPAAALAARPARPSSVAARLAERAHQSREIVYYLQQPETHAFDLAHDYTESSPGTSRYVNVVRAGSRVSNPSARDLDTGRPLRWEMVRGAAIARELPEGSPAAELGPATEAVVFRFDPVRPGETRRLRMQETYTDSARYRLVGDELVWDRGFGRPANAVVLPSGWVLTNSAMPAVVSRLADGRTRLDFVNPRPDELAVLVTARRAAR